LRSTSAGLVRIQHCVSQAVNATLLGTVTDVSAAVVGNAKVTITEINTGVSRTGETNSSGNYSFPTCHPASTTVVGRDAWL